jgi:hypothetical protein
VPQDLKRRMQAASGVNWVDLAALSVRDVLKGAIPPRLREF